MRILFVSERAGFFGGVEQNIHESAAALSKRGHTLGLLYGEECRDMSRMAEPFDFSAAAPDLFRDASEQRQAGWMLEGVERFGPDVIYAHKIGSIAPLLKRRDGVRVVRMIHDHDLCCPRRHKYFAHSQRVCQKASGWRCYLDLGFIERDAAGRLRADLWKIERLRRERWRHAACDALCVGSRFMRDELVMNGLPSERIRIIPPTFQEAGRDADMATPPEATEALYVGQLSRGKGVDYVLKALAHARSSVRLTIAGVGNAESQLRSLCADLGLDDRTRFLGWTPPERLDGLYARSRFVMVPSRWPEPFGMVGLEAMRYGRPVIGFDSGGISDWLRDGVNGRLIPTGNVERMADAIDELAGDRDLCRQMGRAGQEIAAKEFSAAATVRNLEAALGGR